MTALAWSLVAVCVLTLLLTIIEVRRRRWRWLLLSLLLIIICLIWALILLLRWPAAAIVEINESAYQAAPITMVPLVGTYFSFSYPSDWELDAHDQVAPPRFLEKAQVSVAKPHPYRFVVSVETPTEAFAEIPAVQSRRLNVSGPYRETSRQVSGRTMAEFVLESGGYERTLLGLIGGKLYVASLTSPNRTGDGDALFEQYVSSLSFK